MTAVEPYRLLKPRSKVLHRSPKLRLPTEAIKEHQKPTYCLRRVSVRVPLSLNQSVQESPSDLRLYSVLVSSTALGQMIKRSIVISCGVALKLYARYTRGQLSLAMHQTFGNLWCISSAD